jgi:hypothetical protein
MPLARPWVASARNEFDEPTMSAKLHRHVYLWIVIVESCAWLNALIDAGNEIHTILIGDVQLPHAELPFQFCSILPKFDGVRRRLEMDRRHWDHQFLRGDNGCPKSGDIGYVVLWLVARERA